MQKITFLIGGFFLLSTSAVLVSFSIPKNNTISNEAKEFHYLQKQPKFQDSNLIKGSWQLEDSDVELHISQLLKNGALEVNYLNSKFISVEKAGWTQSSNILRLFVLYRQDDNPGYSLSLNYLAEKDLLIGVSVDGSNSKSYNVIFKRIK